MRRLTGFLPLALLVALPAQAGDDRPSRTFVFVYEASIEAVPDGGEQVRLWIPVPMDNFDQEIADVRVAITADGAKGEATIARTGRSRAPCRSSARSPPSSTASGARSASRAPASPARSR